MATGSGLFSRKKVKRKLDVLPYLPRETIKDDLVDTESASIDERTILKLQASDMGAILKMASFSEFVSQIAYDPSVIKFIDSFLWYSRGNIDTCDDDEVLALEKDLSTKVLMVLYRLTSSPDAMNSSSRTTTTTAETTNTTELGELMFENWLFDTPKMIDISRLYFQNNPKITRTILENVLKLQPNYHEDIRGNMHVVAKTLTSFLSRYEKTKNGINQESKKLLADRNGLIDICSGVASFVSAYPPAAKILLDGRLKLIPTVVSIIEIALPVMEADLSTLLQRGGGGGGGGAHRRTDDEEATSCKIARITAIELIHSLVVSVFAGEDTKAASALDRRKKNKTKGGKRGGRGAEAAADNVMKKLTQKISRNSPDCYATFMAMLQPAASKKIRPKSIMREIVRPLECLRLFHYAHPLPALMDTCMRNGFLDKDQVGFLTRALEGEVGSLSSSSSSALTAAAAGPRTKETERNCVANLKQIFGFSPDFADECAKRYFRRRRRRRE